MESAATRSGDVGLTAGLARLAVLAPDAAFAPAAIEAAKRAFVDTLGVALAGWREPAVAALERITPDGGEARALLGGRRLSAGDAARLNGMAGHVLDYDDV